MSIPTSVQERVRRMDSALRLVERRGLDPLTRGETLMIALERRKRNGNYDTIGWVRPDLLGDGAMLIAKLKRNDVRNYGSGQAAANAYDEEEQANNQKRIADRRDHLEQIGKAAYETHMQRRCGSRISNAGMPEAV